MQTTITHNFKDASNSNVSQEVEIKLDQHGLCISVKGDDRDIVLDADRGMVRLFVANADNDVVDPPLVRFNGGDDEPLVLKAGGVMREIPIIVPPAIPKTEPDFTPEDLPKKGEEVYRFHSPDAARHVCALAQQRTNVLLQVEHRPCTDNREDKAGDFVICFISNRPLLHVEKQGLHDHIDSCLQLALAEELRGYSPNHYLCNVWHLRPENQAKRRFRKFGDV